MKTYNIYFVDCNGYGGDFNCKCKNIKDAYSKLQQYARAWNLLPITDVEIKSVFDA